ISDEVEQRCAKFRLIFQLGWVALDRDEPLIAGFAEKIQMVLGPLSHLLAGGISENLRTIPVRWIWPKSSAGNSSTSSKRPPRPPDMQSRDMPVANTLLPSRMF